MVRNSVKGQLAAPKWFKEINGNFSEWKGQWLKLAIPNGLSTKTLSFPIPNFLE